MSYSDRAQLRAENNTLVQVMQYYLSPQELERLNIQLYEFAEQCLASRPHPYLNKSIYAVKVEFKRMETPSE